MRVLHIFFLTALVILQLAAPANSQGMSDETLSCGLGGQYSPDPSGSDVQMMSGGLAVFDFDNDGFEDIFWPAGSLQPSRLYKNDGRGGFTDVAFSAGLDVMAPLNSPSFADIDGDGDLDLFCTTYESFSFEGGPVVYRNFLFRNEGDGTFTDITPGSGLEVSGRWGATWGDLDGDGDLDLVTVTWSDDDNTYFFENNGDETFTERTQPDIKADLIFGFAPTIVDYDGDGDQDVLTSGDYQTSRIWRNEGAWVFTKVNETIVDGVDLDDDNGMGSHIGDFNNDGRLDWFVSSIYSETPPAGWAPKTGNRLYLGKFNGTFTDGSIAANVRDGGWGWGSQMCDINNDGALDIAHVNGMYLPAYPTQQFLVTDTLRIFMNDGAGVMTDAALYIGVNDIDQGRGLVSFDYDDDGDLDLLASNNDTGLTMWRNNILNPGNFLEIQLRGNRGNTYGIGARVRIITPGAPTQTKWMAHGCNFLSQSPPSLWFGTANTSRSRIVVRWPDGTTTSSGVTAANQTIIIQQP